jgi:hypothetical protein
MGTVTTTLREALAVVVMDCIRRKLIRVQWLIMPVYLVSL